MSREWSRETNGGNERKGSGMGTSQYIGDTPPQPEVSPIASPSISRWSSNQPGKTS
ncbi:hypothetical protein LX32DRAFT_641712 [Colletotrichum zoysiae]|uniref:Uncharacterized protein n=1 Tax=Colletotrichum zoysiae TaxID=1216348 RepID=A0AAD9M275_9PEZI|nr:hypothetical protein LX32DRAFT_641712 [Colletotrichum zoysiae]